MRNTKKQHIRKVWQQLVGQKVQLKGLYTEEKKTLGCTHIGGTILRQHVDFHQLHHSFWSEKVV